MQLVPRSVIVPIAGLNSGRLLEVRADDTPPTNNDLRLDPQLAKLFDGGLFQAGAVALAAVRRLRIGSVGIGQLRMLRGQPVPGYLSLANAQDSAGLELENSRSAELGLALAIVAYGGQSNATAIAATGQLDTNPVTGHAEDRDVRVEPVGRLAAKINAIAANIAARRSDERTDHLCLFLPARTDGGADPLVEHNLELDRLRQCCLAQQCTLDVKPVATLGEAVSHLGIRGIHPTPLDRAIAASIGVFVAAVLGLLAWTNFMNAPLRLAFESIILADGSTSPSPLRASFEPSRSAFVMLPACLGAQSTPVFRIGETLVLRATIKDRSRLADRLGGYHFIVVGVSEKSGAKVLPPASFAAPVRSDGAPTARAELDAGTLALSIPIEGQLERTKVIILAKRGGSFDATAVRRSVDAAITGKPENERINAATVALSRLAPGYIDYSFRSAEGEVECAPL